MKPTIPQGTRDFSATVVRKRNFIFNTIRHVFELYGFLPLETPAMENLDTLMGKYGDEGDKLIFKILNNGLERPEKHTTARIEFEKVLAGKNNKAITERALRYDLTIPFARYVAMNYNNLVMPFKRYQIQPVWRADKPQRGRYREFYQCDADVVGSKSLLNEVELLNIYATVFNKLGVEVEIRINSRKILAALAEICGGIDTMMDITIAIDKLDKIGIEKVIEELRQKNLNDNQISTIVQYLNISGTNREKMNALNSLIGNTAVGSLGISEVNYVLDFVSSNALAPLKAEIIADFTLARGLNYYTGIIFEIKAKGVQIGSIGGGGRYDDLTGTFGVPNIPGVGISFGVDRIYDVMEELQLFPSTVEKGPKVLFFNLGETESKHAFILMQQLRNKGIACEIFHEQSKLDKQFKYAEKKNIAYAIIIGSEELENKNCKIKNLHTSEQTSLTWHELVQTNLFD